MSKSLNVPTRSPGVGAATLGTSPVSLVTTESDTTDLKSRCADYTSPTQFTTLLEKLTSTTSTPKGILKRLTDFKNEIGSVPNVNQTGTIDFTTPPEHVDINTFLTKLEGPKKLEYELAVSCNADKVSFQGLDAEKQAMEESKLRLDGIRNSDTHVSYYEGWFPLFRPMSETSLFTVFSISIALLLVSIVAFLRMQGIELQILTPVSNFDFMATLRGYSSYIWAAIAVGLGIAFTATKMNWV